MCGMFDSVHAGVPSQGSRDATLRRLLRAALWLIPVVLFAAPSCVPATLSGQQASMVVEGDRIVLSPQGAIEDITIYAEGRGLKSRDPRCAQAKRALSVLYPGVAMDACERPPDAGSVEAAAATWTSSNSEIPYLVLTRAHDAGFPEGGHVLPIPTSLGGWRRTTPAPLGGRSGLQSRRTAGGGADLAPDGVRSGATQHDAGLPASGDLYRWRA